MITKSMITLLLVGLLPSTGLAGQTSELWGEKGELWKPGESRLADFSNVGYMSGNEPIPSWPVGANVKDFGAVPDDNAPDSKNPESVKDPISKSLPMDAFFKFDLRDLNLRSLAKARFRVSAPRLVRTPVTLSVFSVEDDAWTQETLTAQNAPAPGGELASATVNEEVVEKWLEFDATPLPVKESE
jgi:hypothetical protein